MKRDPDQATAKSTTRGTLRSKELKRVEAVFFRTDAANEPVREWLKAMDAKDRRTIGEDIRTAEYGWPLGMPICRSLGQGLHEIRSDLPGNRISRVFFYVDKLRKMILLHGILKKSQATPVADLALARLNKRKHEGRLK